REAEEEDRVHEPVGGLRTKRPAPRRGTCSAPTTSVRRKKTRSAKRRTAVMTRLSKPFEELLRGNEKPGASLLGDSPRALFYNTPSGRRAASRAGLPAPAAFTR